MEIDSIRHYEDHLADGRNPQVQIDNLTRTFRQGLHFEPQGNLMHLLSYEYPDQRSYWLRRSDHLMMLFFCFGEAPSDLCQGDIDLKDQQLAINLLVTFSAMLKNDEILEQLDGRLREWTVFSAGSLPR